MLSFRRALVAAALFITIIFLATRSTSPAASSLAVEFPKAQPGSQPKQSSSQTTASTNNVVRPGGHRNRPSPPGQQTTMQDMSRMTLFEKLAYQFPYDVDTKFPAYIWQTWKWTPAHGEFRFREQEATWTEQHPSFIHEVITDQVAVHLIRLLYASVPEVLEAYDALPLPVLKADFFRYLILLARGGIYSDIDTYALRSALEWIPESVPRETVGLVIGIEADPDRPDWKEWYSRRIQFCQWTVQSKPGHPVLREVVMRITDETLKRKREGSLRNVVDKNVIEFTGPALWTDIIFDYFNDARFFDMKESAGPIDWQNFTGMEASKRVGDVVVLPITSFSPGVQQMGAGDYDDPMAFVRHDFEGILSSHESRIHPRLVLIMADRRLLSQAPGNPKASGISASDESINRSSAITTPFFLVLFLFLRRSNSSVVIPILQILHGLGVFAVVAGCIHSKLLPDGFLWQTATHGGRAGRRLESVQKTEGSRNTCTLMLGVVVHT